MVGDEPEKMRETNKKKTTCDTAHTPLAWLNTSKLVRDDLQPLPRPISSTNRAAHAYYCKAGGLENPAKILGNFLFEKMCKIQITLPIIHPMLGINICLQII